MMGGAVYALIVNAGIALLFAVAFTIVRFSYRDLRAVEWFCATYVIGMLTPLSELGVRYLAPNWFFLASSYGALLLSTLAMSLGLAAMSGSRLPWRPAAIILLGGAIVRVAIWGGHRDNLLYEMAFQSPFVAAAALSAVTAVGVVRRTSSGLWTAVAILLGFMTVYFLTKPIFAHVFGSGATAQSYVGSAYALFSQATAGILVVTTGLLLLLIAIERAMGRSIRESETDSLTGITNRRGFERRAVEMMADAERQGTTLALAMFDLDHFKKINDRHGHAAGDKVLKAFADLLVKTTSTSDTVARVGGEEFVLLLDRTTLRGAWQTAHAIRRALPGLVPHLPDVTVSGGIAEMKSGDTLETLVKRADQRAYEAKSSGRNRIRPSLEPQVVERLPQAIR